MSRARDTKVFVYGTLQRGGFFHAVLAGADFLGVAWTPARYTLVDLGWYPGLLEGGTTAVRGEVYAVDEATLDRMDVIEEAPEVYVRTPISLEGFGEVEGYVLRPAYAKNARVLPTGIWRPG